MAVPPEAEEDEVEAGHPALARHRPAQLGLVGGGRRGGIVLAPQPVDVRRRQRHAGEQGRLRRSVVRLRVIGPHAALVAEEDLGGGPGDAVAEGLPRIGEQRVQRLRRVPTREREREAPSQRHRCLGARHDLLRQRVGSLGEVASHHHPHPPEIGFTHRRPSLRRSSSAAAGPQLPAA